MRLRERRSGGNSTVGPPAAPTDQLLVRGLEHHQAGRLPEAEQCYRQVLAADPACSPALHLLGALANQVGQHAVAIELISQALRFEPGQTVYHNNLGVAHERSGQLDEAIACYERALSLVPEYGDALRNLALTLCATGRRAEALAAFQRLLKLQPNSVETLNSIGTLLLALGRLDEAEIQLRRALKLQPGDADVLATLGGVLVQAGRGDEAVAMCTRATALAPGHARAHVMLGAVLRVVGQADAAVASYQRALTIQPDAAPTWLNLADALQLVGQMPDAVAAYRQSLALDPSSSVAHSGLIFALDLLPDTADEAIAERQRWNERFGQTRPQRWARHPNRADPDRPLRIGYVSANFCRHSAATTFMPVLRAHDRDRVQMICYSGVASPDAFTAEAQDLADVWHDVSSLTDDALESRIRDDQVDILVDLSGHTAGNRLPVFARKPAPVQVTAWGYATGTGLDAIDYFLADPVVVPPEAHSRYSEEVVSLPSVICYEAPPYLPPISTSPVAERGIVTFGAFNRLPKITPEAVAAWGRILAAVPTGRLVVKASGADVSSERERLLDGLAAAGVSPERITLLGTTPHPEQLAAHDEIDVMLDTFPHTGGVTSLEALLMGVPVVTLLGDRVPGRLSASFLTTLGLADLVAATVDAYVETAAQLARDPDRLVQERATLRGRLLASPICDTRKYTLAVEDAYRMFWRRWCASQTAPQ